MWVGWGGVGDEVTSECEDVYVDFLVLLTLDLGSLLLTWIKFNPCMDKHSQVWNEMLIHFQTSTVALLKFGNG